MNNVMIDFETFGTGKNACVIQVGAAYFDLHTGEIGETFKENINAEDAVKNGAQMDASTVYWWLKQSEQARLSINNPDIVNNLEVETFGRLNIFLSKATDIWSHATFDFVILMESLKRLNIKPKFSFRSARDIRTLLFLTKYEHEKPRSGVHHDALDDCKFQIEYCVAATKTISIPSPKVCTA